jgi:hypothetical protein
MAVCAVYGSVQAVLLLVPRVKQHVTAVFNRILVYRAAWFYFEVVAAEGRDRVLRVVCVSLLRDSLKEEWERGVGEKSVRHISARCMLH